MTTTTTTTIQLTDDQPDIYGQVHPPETDSLIQEKLKEFDAQVLQAPEKKKASLVLAQQHCPDQLTDDFKLQFLRCEVFKTEKAVQRYLKYWDVRRDICGDAKAFLSLTLKSYEEDDRAALAMGMLQLIGKKDPSGRSFLFLDTSRQDWSKYDVHSMARACAYILMAALEDTTTQQKGIVVLAWPKNEHYYQANREFIFLLASSIKGALPVRLSGVHVCQPPLMFRLIFPFVKLVMGERLRKRIRFHTGSQSDIAKTLAPYGFTPDNLPTELGGNVVLDNKAWLEARRAEGK